MAVPAAASTAPIRAPTAFGVPQSPVHWRPTKPAPINAPASPATRMDPNANARASGDGRADNARSGTHESDRAGDAARKRDARDGYPVAVTVHPDDPGLADELLGLARRLGLAAAGLVSDGRRSGLTTVTYKSSPTDMVTEFDHASEQLIVAGLVAARPGDGIVGEEGAARPSTTGLSWFIDPIDGTTNFMYDLPIFAVSIAVADGDGPLVGVVVAPRIGEVFEAVRGGGARRNGEPISASTSSDLASCLLATGFSYSRARRAEQANVVAHVLPRVRDIRRMGAASLDLCNVACGRVDVYYETGLGPWDMAAGSLIATEAGAIVTDFSGGPVRPAEVLASAPGLAIAMRDLLSAAQAERVT